MRVRIRLYDRRPVQVVEPPNVLVSNAIPAEPNLPFEGSVNAF